LIAKIFHRLGKGPKRPAIEPDLILGKDHTELHVLFSVPASTLIGSLSKGSLRDFRRVPSLQALFEVSFRLFERGNLRLYVRKLLLVEIHLSWTR
jgi:hypothetical protein